MKYSDQMAGWLVELGYTHCFFVGGGNIMHLIESLSRQLTCVPVIHEVAAGIATEYFNESNDSSKALALVTAGPGLSNIVTAISGAYLESRELLVIGGQVKTSDLLEGEIRQNGIQEIAGVKLVSSICKESVGMLEPWDKDRFFNCISNTYTARKGPVFIEIPLDIQGRETSFDTNEQLVQVNSLLTISETDLSLVISKVQKSARPVIMIGGGVSRATVSEIYSLFIKTSIPIVTTWNGADRIGSGHPNYCGRPNTWGQRSSNIILQQTDLLIAIGTRLGMQQTGFNWQEFIPVGDIVQIDIDSSELEKGHPKVAIPIQADANDFISRLLLEDLGEHNQWLEFCRAVRSDVPLIESSINREHKNYVSPYKFIQKLSQHTSDEDIIIPCSSGSAFTIMMQVFEQKFGQVIVTDKGLASMGYGLSGAIGASFAHRDKRVVLVEGDGGFSQNLQEIGTAAINNLNLKIFILNDGGYASIRMTQKSYFGGRYVGCDTNTGLGLPAWDKLFNAWGVEAVMLDEECFSSESYIGEFEKIGFSAFIVSIAPEQTYFPKIASKITKTGEMISNPLHLMTPELEKNIEQKVFKYLDIGDDNE